MKVFILFEKYVSSERPWYDYYQYDHIKLGDPKKYWFTEEEVGAFTINENLKKKILNSKVGTKIKIKYLHSCGDLYIKRMDDSYLDLVKNQQEILEEKGEINKKIRRICKEEFELLKILDKKERKLKKEIYKAEKMKYDDRK
jgi:hypothetical protein